MSPAVAPRTTLQRALVALVLLVAAYLQFNGVLGTVVNQPLRADARDYASYGFNLARHATYSRDPTWYPGWPEGRAPSPDALRTPGYPFLLAAFFGDGPTPRAMLHVELVQAALGVIVVAVAYLLFAMLLGFWPALAGAALVALSPHLVVASTYVLTESWFTLWVMLGLFALARAAREERPRAILFAAAGIALGASALVRPTLQYLPAALLPLLAWQYRAVRRWPALLAFTVAFALGPALWALRNEATLGRAADPTVPMLSVLEGSYAGLMVDDDPKTYPFPRRFDPDSARHAANTGAVASHVVAEFRRRPLRMLRWYALEKPLLLFGWEQVQGGGDVFTYPVERSPFLERAEFQAARGVMLALHWPLMVAGLVGAVAVWWPRFALPFGPDLARALRALALVLAFVVAVHVVATSLPRYSVPLRPLSYLFAIVLVEGLRRRAGGAATPVAA